MPDIERRNLKTRPKVGDIVELTWRDHFSFHGQIPAKIPVTAKTWGELAAEDENGFSISETKVIHYQAEYPVDTIHEGQFIDRGGLVEIKKLKTV